MLSAEEVQQYLSFDQEDAKALIVMADRSLENENDIEIETFKQDLLDRIENKLRSGSNMPNYYENNLQEFDHKRSIYESVAQLPSAENTDKVIRYEPHLQRSIEKNLRLLRSLQGYGQMILGLFGKLTFLSEIY